MLAPAPLCYAVRLSADVNSRPSSRIMFGLPQYLMCHRRRVAFTEDNELHYVPERVTLRPPEIYVRDLPRLVSRVQQKGRERVRHRRAPRAQHAVGAHTHAPHPEHSREFGDIARSYFEEDHRVVGRDMIIPAFLLLLQSVLVHIAAVRAVGDDADRPLTRFLKELASRVV